MAKRMMSFGGIVFIVGLILAIIIALFSAASIPMWAVYVLAIIGAIVGLLNITEAETMLFLVASITFLISFQALSGIATAVAFGWQSVAVFFQLLNVFVAPAAAIVALKAVFRLAKD